MKSHFILIIGLVLQASVAFAQQLEDKFVYSSPLKYNPAFTGYTGGSRATVQYFNGTSNFPDSPHDIISNDYYKLTYDHYINALGMGVGMQASRQEGVPYLYGHDLDQFFNKSIGILLSKKIVERKNFVVMVGSGLNYQTRERNSLSYQSGTYIVLTDQKRYTAKVAEFYNFSSGILFATEKLAGGFSALNLGQPNFSVVKGREERLLRSYNAHLAYQVRSRNDNFKFSPDFRYTFGDVYEGSSLSLGTSFQYKWMKTGIREKAFRDYDEVTIYMGYQGKSLSAALSYSVPGHSRTIREIKYFGMNMTYAFKRIKKDKQQLNLLQIVAF